MVINGPTLLNFYPEGKIKFLKIRTDNAIKNHFYSKLRKFIRKILKQINKDNLLKSNGIDPNKYNSDRVYKMIKKNKLAYNSLNKDSILTMILNYEKYSKGSKGESLLSKKTARRKTGKASKENLYSEKVNKRYAASIPIKKPGLSANAGNGDYLPPLAEIYSTHTRSRIKSKNNLNNLPYSLYNTNISTRSRRPRREITYQLHEPTCENNFLIFNSTAKKKFKKKTYDR
jgi:hypothetical protein